MRFSARNTSLLFFADRVVKAWCLEGAEFSSFNPIDFKTISNRGESNPVLDCQLLKGCAFKVFGNQLLIGSGKLVWSSLFARFVDCRTFLATARSFTFGNLIGISFEFLPANRANVLCDRIRHAFVLS